MSKCLLIQHIPAESGFAITDALAKQGTEVDTCRVFANDVLPAEILPFDGLVVMGGPMSATSDEGFPTRRAEIALINQAIAQGLPILGVCLGAQLLAVAAGAAVYCGTNGPEIGWGVVDLSPEAKSDRLLFDLPAQLNVMHWHGDTFDLPHHAAHLASNDRYVNQAFRFGDAAWGVQFHFEVTVEAVDGFLDAFPQEASLVSGGADTIRSATPHAIAQLQHARDTVLGRFATLVASSVKQNELVELN